MRAVNTNWTYNIISAWHEQWLWTLWYVTYTQYKSFLRSIDDVIQWWWRQFPQSLSLSPCNAQMMQYQHSHFILIMSRHVDISSPPPVSTVHCPRDPGHEGGRPHHRRGDHHGQAQDLGLVYHNTSQRGPCNMMILEIRNMDWTVNICKKCNVTKHMVCVFM